MFHLKSPLPLCRHAHGCKKKKIVLVGYTIVILGTTNISHASPYNCYIRHHSCSIKSTIVWINDLFSMILFLTGSVRQSVGRTRTNVTTHRRVSSSIRSVEHDWESIAHESVAVVVATEVELVGRAVELQKCKICSSEINPGNLSIICFTANNNFSIFSQKYLWRRPPRFLLDREAVTRLPSLSFSASSVGPVSPTVSPPRAALKNEPDVLGTRRSVLGTRRSECRMGGADLNQEWILSLLLLLWLFWLLLLLLLLLL